MATKGIFITEDEIGTIKALLIKQKEISKEIKKKIISETSEEKYYSLHLYEIEYIEEVSKRILDIIE